MDRYFLQVTINFLQIKHHRLGCLSAPSAISEPTVHTEKTVPTTC